MVNKNSSLAEFQANNSKLYLVVNDRNYSIDEMFARLLRHVTHILKAVRKAEQGERIDPEYVEYHLCMAFSWTLALLNRFHIDLSKDMWVKFPGLCPYCLSAPCCCKQRPKKRKKLTGKSRGKRPVRLRDWQKMFAEIYPNVVLISAIHLAEEAGEVDEALHAHSATHQEEMFDKAVEELIDVVTNIFAVANCRGIDLADRMTRYFSKNCPGCRHSPCGCGYVVGGR